MDREKLQEILTLLTQNEIASARCLNMVPSENSMSSLAKIPLLLDIYHRYSFDNLEFRGAENVAPLETQLARGLLQEMTGATYVNLRPLSGLNCMNLILAALGGGRGSKVMIVAREQGGHYATADMLTLLGLECCYLTGPDPHTIDFEQAAITLREQRPHLIYIDQSNCLFPLDVERLVCVTREVVPDTLIHIDTSHWMGLVLGGQLPNPLAAGADSFGGSMHKTFPGPQKAIFLTNRSDLAEQVEATQHHLISSHHFAATVSLALALLEFKECGGAEYAANVIRNTQKFGQYLHAYGLEVEGADRGFSRGHQLWVRTTPYGISPDVAGQRLYEAGIRVNVYPSLPVSREPFLRIGVHEATYHGLMPGDMAELANIFISAIKNLEPAHKLAARVAALRDRYRSAYKFPIDAELLNMIRCLVTSAFIPENFTELIEAVSSPLIGPDKEKL